jgi:hypothetical protein
MEKDFSEKISDKPNIVVPLEFTGSAKGIKGIPLKEIPKSRRVVKFIKISEAP